MPKVESAGDLAFVERLLDGAEAAAGRARPLRVQALIETAAGLARVQEIAAASSAARRADPRLRGPRRLARPHGRGRGRPRRVAACPGAAAARRARARVAGDRRPVPRASRSTTAFAAAVARARDARLRRQVGDPPRAARAAERGVHAVRARRSTHAREVIAALARAERRAARAPSRSTARCSTRRVRAAALRMLARAGEARDRRGDAASVRVAGPFFDDLERGEVERDAPALTLTDGHAAVHQAIVGDRLRLALDRTLSRRVLGGERPLAHPALVCDVAIGQSTLAHPARDREPLLPRAGAAPRAADRRHAAHDDRGRRAAPEPRAARTARRPASPCCGSCTVDQQERPVLDFWRCAMLPLRDPERRTGHADDLDGEPLALDAGDARGARRRLGPRRVPRRRRRAPASTSSRPGRAGRSRAATSSARRRSSRG